MRTHHHATARLGASHIRTQARARPPARARSRTRTFARVRTQPYLNAGAGPTRDPRRRNPQRGDRLLCVQLRHYRQLDPAPGALPPTIQHAGGDVIFFY